MKKFITIAGNIGAGKSSLVKLLSDALEWTPFFEPNPLNPYLDDFYKDMPSWSFHSQTFFLAHRIKIHTDLVRSPGSSIQDRSIYEDAEIFARNLHLKGFFTDRDYQTYRSLYESLVDLLPAPDLVIYLRTSIPVIQDRIKMRNRDYEAQIDPEYLKQLNRLYEEWIASFTLCPVLTIPSDDLDWIHNKPHLQLVISKIQEKLTGKEEVHFTPDEIQSP